MAGIVVNRNLSIEKLSVPSIEVEAHQGDNMIAQRVAAAIEGSLPKQGDK